MHMIFLGYNPCCLSLGFLRVRGVSRRAAMSSGKNHKADLTLTAPMRLTSRASSFQHPAGMNETVHLLSPSRRHSKPRRAALVSERRSENRCVRRCLQRGSDVEPLNIFTCGRAAANAVWGEGKPEGRFLLLKPIWDFSRRVERSCGHRRLPPGGAIVPSVKTFTPTT